MQTKQPFLDASLLVSISSLIFFFLIISFLKQETFNRMDRDCAHTIRYPNEIRKPKLLRKATLGLSYITALFVNIFRMLLS